MSCHTTPVDAIKDWTIINMHAPFHELAPDAAHMPGKTGNPEEGCERSLQESVLGWLVGAPLPHDKFTERIDRHPNHLLFLLLSEH